MATYLLSVHHRDGDPAYSDDDAAQRAFEQVDALNDQLRSAGVWVFAGGLQPPDAARVVRGRGDAAVTTDGPFVESKEHLGGFWIIDADDLDAALEWAGKATEACLQPVEVQPCADFSDVPPAGQGRPEFLLSVHIGPGDPRGEPMTEEQQRQSMQEMQRLEADMQTSGTWMFSARLAGPDTATMVSSPDGDVVLTDGPFVESKEHLAGFYVIGADDLDEALDWGRRVTACVGAPIEVRPFQVEPAT